MEVFKKFSKAILVVLVGVVSCFCSGCSEEKPEAFYIEVQTGYPTDEQITQTKALLSGSIMIQSGIVSEFGFYLSNKRAELETAASGAKIVISDDEYTNFTYQATGLAPATTYYYRVFASNGNSSYFGDIFEFTTRERSEPVLGEFFYSNVTENSVDLKCSILDSGEEAESNLTYGFQYQKEGDANFVSETDGVQLNEDGSFSVTLTDLSSATGYVVRAFAKNSYGYGYSSSEYITTTEKLTPILHMDDIQWDSNVTATGVTVYGYIDQVYSKDGKVSEVGFVYAPLLDVMDGSLTIASGKRVQVEPNEGDYGAGGTFVAELVNVLQPNTMYRIRPYAKDEGTDGTVVYGYGDVQEFITREFQAPSLGWLNASAKGINSISVSVESLSYDGSLMEYGFIWAKAEDVKNEYGGSNLTLDNCGDNKIKFTPTDGEKVSSFEALIENLETNTEYAIKAYAISSYDVNGETYKSEVSYSEAFCTTEDLKTPAVDYVELEKRTYTTMTLTSGVDSYDEMAELTECGFIWMDNATYEKNGVDLTLDNCGENKLIAELGENDAFEGTITSLKVGTQYRVAAYITVTYSNGETRTGYYSNIQSTLEMSLSVSVGDVGVDSIAVSAIAGEYWDSNDWTELGDTLEAGFCWTTKENIEPAGVPEENRVSAELADSGNQKTFAATISVPEESGVTYYIWAYLKYKDGYIYSERTSTTSKNIPEKDDHGNPEIKD